MDQRCIYYQKPLLESGTLGTKVNQLQTNVFCAPCGTQHAVYWHKLHLRGHDVLGRTA